MPGARLKNRRISKWVPLLLTIVSGAVWAHQGHRHGEAKGKTIVPSEEELLKQINTDYLVRVRPIFQKSCFDCHGNTTRYPWYYRMPGAKQLIDHDIQESKEHLDMSVDFPFKGHGSPKEDLQAIRESVEKGEMPPFRYFILHSGAKLKDAEKKAVTEWATRGMDLLTP